jgi:hypothetical protein
MKTECETPGHVVDCRCTVHFVVYLSNTPHAQPISFFLILSPARYWVRSTNHVIQSPPVHRYLVPPRSKYAPHHLVLGEERGVYRVLMGKPEGTLYLGDLGVDGLIILGWISRRWNVGIWTGLDWPRIETGGGRL